MKSSRKTTVNEPSDVEKAVYLHAQGYRQKAIGEKLGKSQPMVCLLLKKGRGLCHWHPELRVPEVALDWLRRRWPPKEDKEALGLDELLAADPQGRLREVHVFRSGRPQVGESHEIAFGRFAAHRLCEDVLPKTRSAAVTWGWTIRHVVDGVQEVGEAPRLKKTISFLPACADPAQVDDAPETGASVLAAKLSLCVNGASGTRRSLNGVRAVVPAEFDEADRMVILRYFRKVSRFFADNFDLKEGRVIGDLAKANTVLAGIGSAEHWSDPNAGDGKYRELTMGNLGGALLPKPGLSQKELDWVEKANRRWVGMQLADFAERARLDRPGVVVFAAGGAKAGVAAECIRKGLVNILVIDEALHRRLRALLAKPAAR